MLVKPQLGCWRRKVTCGDASSHSSSRGFVPLVDPNFGTVRMFFHALHTPDILVHVLFYHLVPIERTLQGCASHVMT